MGNIIDRKGYVRVPINKHSIALHKLLAKAFLDLPEDKAFTIDHIDGDNK